MIGGVAYLELADIGMSTAPDTVIISPARGDAIGTANASSTLPTLWSVTDESVGVRIINLKDNAFVDWDEAEFSYICIWDQ